MKISGLHLKHKTDKDSYQEIDKSGETVSDEAVVVITQ